MIEQTISVLATFTALPGKEDELRKQLSACVAYCRDEQGNLAYDLYQNVENSCVFLCREQWQSEDYFAQHLRQPHLQQLMTQCMPLLSGAVQIEKF